ncbi:unnamed protein product [Rotaria sp. Silwood2]|nr:unnamed protein product [Rotaria sp. Silwood2]CAF2731812.1 unnamed protein product [Rotaria sp. Silwood2]CAF3035030.1 unnamed protein product [Rotaria sp. Silwood2]CAF4111206.1 unnamed protein product [Rotaria sp. Silwood2]CAF4131646.1 unnamed protein product [Rotaria sp. Silwood2]
MWLDTTASDVGTTISTNEEEQTLIHAEKIQLTDEFCAQTFYTQVITDTNDSLDNDEASKLESANDDSSDEEKEQLEFHEKLNDFVDEQIFENPITSDAAVGNIVFGVPRS